MPINNMKNSIEIVAITSIVNVLKNGFSGDYCNLNDTVIESDLISSYIDYCNITNVIEKYGLFDAIKIVRDYEVFNYDGFFSDISKPKVFLEILLYVTIDRLLGSALQDICIKTGRWVYISTESTNNDIIEYLIKYIQEG